MTRRPAYTPVPAPATDKLWSLQEAAAWLGLAPATLYRWRHEGRGPAARKVGKYVRYRPADVKAYDEQAKPKPRRRAS